MITITVKSYNGTPLAQPLAASFDELGGNIGRADNNQLVLPDPERTISRVHAQVVFRSGRFGIVDRGSNPISVNGRPLGNGHEAPLQTGDELQIGGYALKVEEGASVGGKAADPFADFGGLAAAPAGRARGGAAAPAAFTDPLAAFGVGAPSSAPTRAGAGGGFGAPGGAPSAASPGAIPADWDPFAPDAAAKAQPQDFARSLGQAGAGGGFGLDTSGRASAPLIPDLPAGAGAGAGGDSLDHLFGLGGGAGGGADPLANSVFARPDAAPNMAANADPIKSLNSIGRSTQTAAEDNLSELNAPFIVPGSAPRAAAPQSPAMPAPALARPAAAPTGAPTVPPTGAGAAQASTRGAVLSWDDGAEGRTVIRPKGGAAGPATAGTPAAAAAPSGAPARPGMLPPDLDSLFDAPLTPGGAGAAPSAALIPDDAFADILGTPAAPPPAAPTMPAAAAPTVAPAIAQAGAQLAPASPAPAAARAAAPRAAPATGAAPGADQGELIAALRDGLRMPTLPIDTLTPEFMKLIGQLVHESTRGTVDLLVARAALKREIRAEMTMIVAKENNPLKFSPSVEVALQHLLSPPARGFMSAERAMRDAYDDLRAHQFGFLAGLRAALEGILRRFDPAQLEGKLTQKKSMLASLLPAGRKAKLWDVFQEMYGQISSEAEDDFHELFGKEFLKAYEAYIDRLDQERR